jgi:hypothetical protein
LITISSLLFLAWTQNAAGFLVAETPLMIYHNSDMILIGNVISHAKIGNFTQEDQYIIQVEEYIKNKQPGTTINATGMGYTDSSPPIFEVGDRVLFVLDGNGPTFDVSPDSFKTISGCTAHQMLGFRLFPDEPLPNDVSKIKFVADKNCLGSLVQINPSEDVFFSPLTQFKSGTDAKEIACKEGSVLVIKSDNGFPACVKPDTSSRLVVQGWVPGPINKITTDVHNVYYTNDTINFSINFKGFVQSCDYPHVSILDSNQNVTWKSNSFAILCDPEMNMHPVYVNQTYQLSGGLGGPITINHEGDYTLKVSFYDQNLNTDFTVIAPSKYG